MNIPIKYQSELESFGFMKDNIYDYKHNDYTCLSLYKDVRGYFYFNDNGRCEKFNSLWDFIYDNFPGAIYTALAGVCQLDYEFCISRQQAKNLTKGRKHNRDKTRRLWDEYISGM